MCTLGISCTDTDGRRVTEGLSDFQGVGALREAKAVSADNIGDVRLAALVVVAAIAARSLAAFDSIPGSSTVPRTNPSTFTHTITVFSG